jgi:hypothetical protein
LPLFGISSGTVSLASDELALTSPQNGEVTRNNALFKFICRPIRISSAVGDSSSNGVDGINRQVEALLQQAGLTPDWLNAAWGDFRSGELSREGSKGPSASFPILLEKRLA